MGIKVFTELASVEFENSKKFTKKLQHDITNNDTGENGKPQQQIKNERRQRNNATLDELRVNMTQDKRRTKRYNMETGASNWLTCLPIIDLGYHLNKEQFWDAIWIRYGWTLPRLPSI